MKKIAIIGGGASGMFCAITALENNKELDVVIFEKMERVGKKLLATGNGRCNLTNSDVLKCENGKPIHYHGKKSEFCLDALNAFSNEKLIDYFEANGVKIMREGDKFYPFSEQAGTVLDFLRFKCSFLGASFRTASAVNCINANANGFNINGEYFDCAVVATGGKSSPHLGTDGSGYALLTSFAHKLSPLYPAITQIKTETTFVKQLKGIKADALCGIYVDGILVKKEYGQVLFAEYGLSGPPIFQLSGIAAKNDNKKCEISLDFMSRSDYGEVLSLIKNTISNPFFENMTNEYLLSLCLNKRLGQIIVKSCGIKLSEPVSALSDKCLKMIAAKIKDFRLPTYGVKGFANAQVTSGGIETDGFDSLTLESKNNKGLYACGEVLDIDGDCGGFNLQWAFSSGYAVGKAVSK